MRNADFHRQLGKRITELRRRHEMSQAELARILGVSQQTVFAYELGDRRVSLDLVAALLNLFRVSCDELLGLRPVRQLPARRISPAELRHVEQLRQLTRGDKYVVKRVAEALRR